jgi:hypothetical protein
MTMTNRAIADSVVSTPAPSRKGPRFAGPFKYVEAKIMTDKLRLKPIFSISHLPKSPLSSQTQRFAVHLQRP